MLTSVRRLDLRPRRCAQGARIPNGHEPPTTTPLSGATDNERNLLDGPFLLAPTRCLDAVGIAACSGCGAQPDERPASRPNIVWITAKDISRDLGCYGDAYAVTPNIDRIARKASTTPRPSPPRRFARRPLVFDHRAVCTTLGTQHLRSLFPIPVKFHGYPAYLRAAGYYCTNNEKTDYNTASEPAIIAASWDESSGRAHWRNAGPLNHSSASLT